MSAITSNMLFGQGPWTPFQMLSWGLIGCLAGLPWICKVLGKSYWFLILYGIFAGFFFPFSWMYGQFIPSIASFLGRGMLHFLLQRCLIHFPIVFPMHFFVCIVSDRSKNFNVF
ncbi:hypothetical protein GQR36_08270 [Enterococcus termitis]